MPDDGYLEFILDQLSRMRGVRPRSMFGGVGLYEADIFFAIVHDGRIYFVTDDETAGAYVEKGMQAFAPKPDQVLKNYYEVPVDVVEDDLELCRWARTAVEAQKRRQHGNKAR